LKEKAKEDEVSGDRRNFIMSSIVVCTAHRTGRVGQDM